MTTNTLVNSIASGQNGGGGLVSVGAASATAGGSSHGTLTVNGGAQLTAGTDLTVSGTTDVNVNAIAASSNVGLGSGVETHTNTSLSFSNTTTVDGSLTALGRIKVEAHSNTDGEASSDSSAGGLGADANSDAHVTINPSTTTVDLQGDAKLRGTDIEVNAYGDKLKGNAHSHTHATALGAASNATSSMTITATTLTLLETGSSIIGDAGVTIRANNTVDLTSVADSSCSCLGGGTNSDSNITDNDVAKVIGRYNAFIKSSGFEVDANEFVSTWNRAVPRDGATFDGGGTSGSSHFNAARQIFWEAHVILAPRSPVVIVDSSGTITALVNATVRSYDPNTHALSGPLAIGDAIPVGDWISVDDLINTGGGAGSFNANAPGSQDGSTPPNGVIWGNHGLLEIQQTWSTVTLQNFSNRTLETHLISVEASASVEVDIHVDTIPGPDGSADNVSLDENAPAPTFEFDIKHIFPPTFITISNRTPGHPAAPDTNDVVLDGTIVNPIGTTLLENEHGNILSGPDNPGKVVRTNILLIDADAGSAGLLGPSRAPIAVELVWSNYRDDAGLHERPIVLNADVAVDLVLDITSILRESPSSLFSPSLGPVHVGHDADLQINDSVFGTALGAAVGTLAVGLFDPPSGTPSPNPPDTYKNHFRPDTVIVPDPNEDVRRAFGNDRTNLDSAYTFTDLSAGHIIHAFHTSTATTITFMVFSDVDATLHDADTGALVTSEDKNGRIDLWTNGWIVDIETSSDLRVGEIVSTNGDVTLRSPAAILDAELDGGVLGTDPTPTDVSARNITMVAGNNSIGGISGRGGIGLPYDFLEIHVNADGGDLGVLNAFDTQVSGAAAYDLTLPLATLPPASKTFGIFINESIDDMQIDTVQSKGNVSLSTFAGSLLDARNGGSGDDTANVIGNTINLYAQRGSIGQDGGANDLEIDSQYYAAGTVGARADDKLYLTETSGPANVVLLQAFGVDNSPALRFTVRESASLGEDLNLLAGGIVLFVQNAPETVANGLINTPNGSILLRVGDNVTTDANSQITAGHYIDICGDYRRFRGERDVCGNFDTVDPPVNDTFDPGVGTVMHFAGEITPGVLGARLTWIARIFGNADNDAFYFDQTDLDGKTRVYGSNRPTDCVGVPPGPCGADAPAGDGQDYFEVNQLETMDVAAGHTLTLDGQSDTDTYVVNTAGSNASEHNYVINVLDTGAKNNGLDTLTVNGTGDDDTFLLRQVSWIGEAQNFSLEYAETPAFVALLHGSVDDIFHRTRADVERVNYDENINSRLTVNGFGGNDTFATDDNSSITTLDGGAGDDTFLIGQAYANPRIAPDVAAEDAFPTVYTTLGYLSNGISFPTTVFGGTGDDSFLVYSNKAALRLEGGTGDDLFAIRTAPELNPADDGMVVDTFATPEDWDSHWHDSTGDNVPVYNVDAPVDIVGGADCNRLVVVGSEFGKQPGQDENWGWYWSHHRDLDINDNFTVTDTTILGAGLNLTFSDLAPQQLVEHNPCDFCTTGLAFLGVDSVHGDGIWHDDDPLPIISEDLTGISAVMNQQVSTVDTSWGHSNVHDTESATGIALNVATTSVGQVIVRESGGSTRVYEQGTTTDTYTVSLVSSPTAAVYVNVSAASSPSEAAAAGARTVLVSIDGGVTWQFAAVLTFAAGDSSAKTVLIRAIDDSAPEFTLDATLSMSAQSADPTYNHAEIRNVLAEVIDNDTAGIVITETANDTTVLVGAPPYGIVDTYTVAPTMAPALYTNVKVTLFYDRGDLIVTSTDPRFDPVTRTFTFDWTNWTTPAVVQVAAAPDDPHWGENWDDPKANGAIWHVVTSLDPAYVAVFGQGIPYLNPCCGGDQGHVEWSDGHGWLDEHGWENDGWDAQHGWQNWYGYWDGFHGWHSFPHVVPRLDVNILRPDADVVYVVESDGSTLVATGDPNGDTYTMRLTAAPDSGQTIRVKLQSDGQTLGSDACGCDGRFDASSGTVTFDSTNWYLPFTVRLTSNPGAPATDPFQPIETFPNPSADRVFETSSDPHDWNLVGGIRFGNGWFDGRGWLGGPVWVDGHGWYDGSNWFDGHGWFNGYDGWWFDGDNWFDGHHAWFASTEPSLHSLLCNDGSPDHWHHGDWSGWGWNWSFGCDDLPARQPIILPAEQGAGPPPVFRSISSDLVVEATSAAGATVTYDPARVSGEVGPATITYSQNSGTTFAIGTTTVNVYAIDEGGNYQSETFNVKVRDTTAPVITSVSANLTAEATSAAGAVVTYPAAIATDAVGPITYSYSKASGATFAIGTTAVTVTATDAYGNHSSKSFTVTVADTTPPVLTVSNMSVNATQLSGWLVGTFSATATDAVGSTITYSKAVGSVLPYGVTTVTATAKDAAGHSVSANFTVTVADTLPPVITAPNVVVEATSAAGAKATFAPTATDAGSTFTITTSVASNSQFIIGVTTVNVTRPTVTATSARRRSP